MRLSPLCSHCQHCILLLKHRRQAYASLINCCRQASAPLLSCHHLPEVSLLRRRLLPDTLLLRHRHRLGICLFRCRPLLVPQSQPTSAQASPPARRSSVRSPDLAPSGDRLPYACLCRPAPLLLDALCSLAQSCAVQVVVARPIYWFLLLRLSRVLALFFLIVVVFSVFVPFLVVCVASMVESKFASSGDGKIKSEHISV